MTAELTTDILIDEEKVIAPFWIRSSKNKGQVRQHSDHNAFFIKYKIPCSQRNEIKSVESNENNRGWKITEGGMKEYMQLTNQVNYKINSDEILICSRVYWTQ